MAKVTVQYEEVVRPVKEVTITLSKEEAEILKLITNYRSRIADAIYSATGKSSDHREVSGMLYGLFRTLHDQGVHAKDRN